MRHQRRAFRPILAHQRGQEADAVLRRIRRNFRAHDLRRGRHEIREAHDVRTARAGLHFSRPAHDERHAVPALENVRLVPPEARARVVPLRAQLVEFRLRRAPVVAREDDHRVLRHARLVERREHGAQRRIHLHHEIAVRIQPALILPFRQRIDGRVRRVQREVEEKWALLFCQRPDPAGRHARERRQHVQRLKILRRRPLPRLPAILAIRHHRECDLLRRHLRHMIIFDERVRHHVQRRRDAEVIVEPHGIRPVRDRLREVHAPHLFRLLDVQFLDRLPLVLRPIHPEMPLAHARRRVALVLQHLRHGEPPLLDQPRAQPAEHAALELRAPVVAPRDHAVARRRADGGRRVRIRKFHPERGEPVHVRRRDFSVRIEALHIADAQIVRENKDDVRLLRRDGECGRQHDEEQGEDAHRATMQTET